MHDNASGTQSERRTLHYSGRVQGVGFRYTARQLAEGFAVTGYVENLDDGRVRLVAEGEPDELDRFIRRLADAMGRHIHHVDISTSQPTGEYDRFTIAH